MDTTAAAVDTIAARAAAVEAITQVPQDVRAAAGMTEEPATAVAAGAITEAVAITEDRQDAAAVAVETAAAVEEIMAAEAITEAIKKEALPATGDKWCKAK